MDPLQGPICGIIYDAYMGKKKGQQEQQEIQFFCYWVGWESCPTEVQVPLQGPAVCLYCHRLVTLQCPLATATPGNPPEHLRAAVTEQMGFEKILKH